MAETTTVTWWPAAAYALQVGHRGAAKFHHDAGQEGRFSNEGALLATPRTADKVDGVSRAD